MGIGDLPQSPLLVNAGLNAMSGGYTPPPPQQASPVSVGMGLNAMNGGYTPPQGIGSTGAAAAPPPPPQGDWMAGASKALGANMGTVQADSNAAAAASAAGPAKINFVSNGTGGTGGSGGASDLPLNIQAARAGMLVPAHDVQLGAERVVQEAHAAQQAGMQGQENLTAAKVDQNDAAASAIAGRAGVTQGTADAMAKAHADKDAKIDKALKLIDPRDPDNQIDPNHYMSQMSVGKRILLATSAGLMQMGMGLRGTGGKNPILEQMEQETARDIDAQKHKLNAKMSLYGQLKEQGLSDEEAQAGVEKYHALAANQSIDSVVQGSNSPVLKAEGDVAKAQIQAHTAEADSHLYGRAQAQVVGGSAGWTKDMSKAAEEMYNKDHEKGGTMSIDQARVNIARINNVPYSGGPSQDAAPIKTGAAGGGRSAGVQMEYQQNLNRYNAFLSQLDQAEKMVGQGGSIDKARTAQGQTLLHGMAAELGYVNAGKSPNETELQTAKDMLPSDLNSYQFTGSDKAKLAQVRQMIEEKRAQLMKAGPAIAQGTGFLPGTTTTDEAAASGATEQ